MATSRPKPLLSFELLPAKVVLNRDNMESPTCNWDADEPNEKKKHWTAYILTCVAAALILLPHILIFKLLVNFYLLTLQARGLFLIHLSATYTLTFLALTSFLVAISRDPGPVDGIKAQQVEDAARRRSTYPAPAVEDYDGEGNEISLTEALLPSKSTDEDVYDSSSVGVPETRWCQKCWSPKPERCHHCSECGRCVLKMDHHCPWLGAKCVGHRTYPAFFHLLTSVTALCLYTFVISAQALRYYLSMSVSILESDWAPYQILFLAMIALIFGLTVGSFWGYHVYLISTNRTTLEHLAPFLLLRHLPAPTTRKPSNKPKKQGSSASSTSTAASPARDGASLDSPYFFPSPPPNQQSFDSDDSSVERPQNVRLHERDLNPAQRRRVRYAHGKIHLYDLGFRENWVAVFGGGRRSSWLKWAKIFLFGGSGKGDGYTFELNPKAHRQLARLADELSQM